MPFIFVKGLKTYYHITGEGKPIVFLHGWGGTSKSFYKLQTLLSKGYKTISFDMPGFGETDIPSSAWGVEDYMNFTLECLEKFKITSYYLVGHSFGGRVAILLAAKHPEKLSGLALISAAGIKHKKLPEEKALAAVASLGKYIMSFPLARALKEPARYIFYKLIRRQDYVLAKGIMKETMKNVIAQDLREYLPLIKTKTLIVWGDKDMITPLKDGYAMQKEIPGAVLKIIKGGSHYLPRKNPQELFRFIYMFLL